MSFLYTLHDPSCCLISLDRDLNESVRRNEMLFRTACDEIGTTQVFCLDDHTVTAAAESSIFATHSWLSNGLVNDSDHEI